MKTPIVKNNKLEFVSFEEIMEELELKQVEFKFTDLFSFLERRKDKDEKPN